MRGILRGVATGVGAVALLWSAAACTGAEEQPPDGGSAPTSATEPDEGATDTGSPTYSPAGQSPYGEEDLQTASQRFVDLLHVLDDQDWEAACGMVLDPTTGIAPEGERRQESPTARSPPSASTPSSSSRVPSTRSTPRWSRRTTTATARSASACSARSSTCRWPRGRTAAGTSSSRSEPDAPCAGTLMGSSPHLHDGRSVSGCAVSAATGAEDPRGRTRDDVDHAQDGAGDGCRPGSTRDRGRDRRVRRDPRRR